MKPAVVISTYNDPRSLGICLKGFTNQTHREFQIFIADDGSGPETRKKIESFQSSFKYPIQHFWHEDQGYKKARINNEVFRNLKGFPLVICVDGDTFSHYRFIEDHCEAHKKKDRYLFMGRRVDLGADFSSTISEENVQQINEGFSPKLFLSGLKGDSQNVLRSIRVENPFLQKVLKRDRVPDLLGSNFSVTRELLFDVNGYNEDFKSYWGEDGDLFIRLRNAGAEISGSKSVAIQYHLYHARRDPDPEHVRHYEELLEDQKYVRCKNGIQKEDEVAMRH